MLGLCQFCPSLCRLTGMLQIAASITAITLLELGDCLCGSYGRLLWMPRISGKGELARGKQADYGEARWELYLSHATVLTWN